MYTINYPCDMHSHSKRSDGNDTVRELIDVAVGLGMKVLVLSDHDVNPPDTIDVDGVEMDPVAYAKQKGLVFIPGIEYSCDTYVDDCHIVGIGCDWHTPKILQAQADMETSKVNGYRKLTEILCADGIDVSWDYILEGGGSGTPRKPGEVQRKHIFEAIANKGYTETWSDAKIMVRDNPKYNVRREKIAPADAIAAIHEGGGWAILAHPHLIDAVVTRGDGSQTTRDDYIEELIAAGLDGIEACYTYDKTSYKGTQTKAEIEQEIRDKYTHRLKIISGGSDYHNDGKKGVKNPRMIGECGITMEYMQSNPIFKEFLK